MIANQRDEEEGDQEWGRLADEMLESNNKGGSNICLLYGDFSRRICTYWAIYIGSEPRKVLI